MGSEMCIRDSFWCKHHTFQEAIHVPLIISSPKKKKNVKSDALVEYIDIYPTVSELAGIEPPDYIHGKSLVPILESKQNDFKTEIYSRYQFREVVQDYNYSYHEILNYDKFYLDRRGARTPSVDSNARIGGYMLFDMKNDIKQSVDISKDPKNKDIVEKYSEKLKKMREFSNQPIVIKWKK